MEKITVNIICQYQENYAYYEGKQHWKPKGSVVFSVQLDLAQWMYDDQRCKEIMTRLTVGKSNDLVRYEVVEFETVLDEPINITQEFNKEYLGEHPYRGCEHDLKFCIEED